MAVQINFVGWGFPEGGEVKQPVPVVLVAVVIYYLLGTVRSKIQSSEHVNVNIEKMTVKIYVTALSAITLNLSVLLNTTETCLKITKDKRFDDFFHDQIARNCRQ